MIINWQGLYQNSEYYSAGLYGTNGIVGYTAIVGFESVILIGFEAIRGNVVHIKGKIKIT